jgi:hypothetical protein
MLSSSFIAGLNSGYRLRGLPATLVVSGPGSFVPEASTADRVGNGLPFYLIGTASLPAGIAATWCTLVNTRLKNFEGFAGREKYVWR